MYNEEQKKQDLQTLEGMLQDLEAEGIEATLAEKQYLSWHLPALSFTVPFTEKKASNPQAEEKSFTDSVRALITRYNACLAFVPQDMLNFEGYRQLWVCVESPLSGNEKYFAELDEQIAKANYNIEVGSLNTVFETQSLQYNYVLLLHHTEQNALEQILTVIDCAAPSFLDLMSKISNL